MDLQSQAIIDAGGIGMSARDRLLQVGRISARTLLCVTLPFGFANRGAAEILFFAGVWLLITSSQYIFNIISMTLKNMLGHNISWGTPPALRMKVYAIVGPALIAVSEFHIGLGGDLRIHWGQLISVLFFVGFWAVMVGIVWFAVARARGGASLGLQHLNPLVANSSRRATYDAYFASRFSFFFGISTGDLSRRDPEHSLLAGLRVKVTLADGAKGVLVSGPMGSGKSSFTFSVTHDAARQPGTGLLSLSAKPGDGLQIAAICRQYRSHGNIHVVGPDNESMNLLAGMTYQRVAAAFRSLSRDEKNPFWSNYGGLLMGAAAALAWGLDGVTVQVLNPKKDAVESEHEFAYNLKTIHTIIWARPDIRFAALETASLLIPDLRSRGEFAKIDALDHAINYFTTSFVLMQESKSTLSGVLSGIEPFLLPFIGGIASRTWCDEDGINLTEVLDRGECVILNPDKAANPELFALVANFCVAGHLGDLALRRTGRSNNDEHPIVCLLDEFGSYASEQIYGLCETARESRIVLVVSIISITSLAARLGKDGAASLPASFGNWICFGAPDFETRKLLDNRIGKVRMNEVSSSSSTSSSSGPRGTTSSNQSTSSKMSEVSIVDDSVWRSLGVNAAGGYSTALAVVSESGQSLHDVLRVPPAASAQT